MRMTRRGKPHYLLIGCIILGAIVCVSALVLWISMRPVVAPSKSVTPTPVKQQTDDVHTVTFSAMGDMLAHEAVNVSAKTANGYDYQQYFTDIKPLYSTSDVVFCNPETLSAGSAYIVSGYPQFNTPTEFARDLMGVGCNIFNYASNHVADKGESALKASLDNWDSLKPLAITGANRSQKEQDTVKYFTKNDIRFALLAFADFSNMPMPEPYSVNIYHDTALVERLMKEARAHADVVLVSMHWATEDSTVVNDDQREAAGRLANLGADIVIGTGPHVLQSVTTLPRPSGGTTLVWYSIGNVLSTQMWVNELTGGVARWTVTKRDGMITTDNLGYDATFMSYSYSNTADGGKIVKKGTLKLQPLAGASVGVAKWGTTVAERTKFVHDTLGNSVKIAVTP